MKSCRLDIPHCNFYYHADLKLVGNIKLPNDFQISIYASLRIQSSIWAYPFPSWLLQFALPYGLKVDFPLPDSPSSYFASRVPLQIKRATFKSSRWKFYILQFARPCGFKESEEELSVPFLSLQFTRPCGIKVSSIDDTWLFPDCISRNHADLKLGYPFISRVNWHYKSCAIADLKMRT